jgi:hypothetical protein
LTYFSAMKYQLELRASSLLLLLFLLSSCGPGLRPPNRKFQSGELHYSARVGGVLGEEGKPFLEDFLNRRGEITSIEVGESPERNFRVIQCIRIEYRRGNGNREKVTLGNPDGARFRNPYRVGGRQELVGFSGRGGWWIDAIRFHFSDGSVYPTYGGDGGDTSFETILRPERNGRYRGRVTGFYGSAGQYLESLGLIFEPAD